MMTGMRIVLFFAIFFSSSLIGGEEWAGPSKEEIEGALALFPKTSVEVEQYTDQTLNSFMENLSLYKEQPLDKLTFASTVLAFHQMLERMWAKSIALSSLSLISSDEDLLQKARREVFFLLSKLQSACNDPVILQMVLTYAKSKESLQLTPSERYILWSLLESAVRGWTQNDPLREEAKIVADQLAAGDLLPYTPLEGSGAHKSLSPDKKITVMNWNVCFFPEGLSMLFGGVLPWQDRLEGVAEKIKRTNADIVCLQEVFSTAAALDLYRLLKEEYAYFAIHIGPKPYGFDSNSLGLSSGLFVASKYPMDGILFTPFTEEETPKVRGYGFFSFTVQDSFRLVTTHLNPGQDPGDLKYRKAQLKAIYKSVDERNGGHPTFLCGDFNIEKTSTEYQEEVAPYCVNNLTGNQWTCLELRNFWWKAGQDVAKFKGEKLEYENIDYFLEVKKTEDPKQVKSFTTQIVVTNPIERPAAALSDHQALFSIISLKK